VVMTSGALQALDLTGFWDCGAAAGQALGRAIKDHPCLEVLKVGMGSLRFAELRASKHSSGTLDIKNRMLRDCGAGVLSECLPQSVRRLNIRGSGVGASGYKVLSKCAQLEEIDGIPLGAFTEDCTILDLSGNPLRSTGAVACVIARTALTPNLTHLNLSGCNLTSKSHVHQLTPVVGRFMGIGCNGGCDCRDFQGNNAYKNCSSCDLDFCSTCCMSECPMVALAEALDRLPHLVSLGIANCAFEGGRDGGPVRSHLDEESYHVLGAALRRHEKLSHVDLSQNYFKGPGFPHLARQLALMPALLTVKVGASARDFKQWLTAEALEPSSEWSYAELLLLARAVARNPRLRRLDLSEVKGQLRSSIVEALVESLCGGGNDETTRSEAGTSGPEPIHVHGAKRVTLDELVIEGPHFVLPFRQLQDGTVSSLDFSTEFCRGCEELAPLLALALSCSTSLTDLDLSNQDFGKATQNIVDAALALTMGKGGPLQRCNGIDVRPGTEGVLRVSKQRPIMPLGVSVLAATALPHGSLTTLDLDGCGMSSESLEHLLSAMLRRQTVTSLNVSRSELRGPGMQALADFLRVDKRLRTLQAQNISGLRQASFSETLEFARALETNLTLVNLDLRQNLLHTAIVERLRRTMEERRRVVPFPTDAKICFLLCNQRLPWRLRLPPVLVSEVSNLVSDGGQSPLVQIFQYCSEARQLLLDDGASHSDRASHSDGSPPSPRFLGSRFLSSDSDMDSD